MIEMDPKETSSYFGLANIYEQSGDYEHAEKMLIKAREMRPNDSAVYMQLAGFYNRQGEFTKTMEALHARAEQEPNNPEAHYTIATYYWEKAYRDFTTPEADKVKFVQQGSRRRQGDQAEPELLRGADLQEPPAARPGQPGKEPGPAAGAPEGSQQLPRQGAGSSQQGQGRRRRIEFHNRAPVAARTGRFPPGERPFFFACRCRVSATGLRCRLSM